MRAPPPPGPPAVDSSVDVLVVGSGTGMAAALAAHERGLSTLIIEKTAWVGGSTARSGGAFWVPQNPALQAAGARDSLEQARVYLDALVGDDAPAKRRRAFLENGPAAIELLSRLTPLEFFWSRGYSDYHPETPGGSALGRTCESVPFDLSKLGAERARFRPGLMEAPVPMPVTGADYKWFNLMLRKPFKAFPRILKRVFQGLFGLLLGQRWVAGGQALAAGLFAGVIRAQIPVWTNARIVELINEGGRVTGAVVEQHGRRVKVLARRGVVLAAGGFDHDMKMRHEFQSPALLDHASLGAEGNTGDAIKLGQSAGAAITLMTEAWWFPAVAPFGDTKPQVLLAERALPGSFMVDEHGKRFINEATDYMTFGQTLLAREKNGAPVKQMWLVFDQQYRNNYVLAGVVFPRQPLPKTWLEAGIAFTGDSPRALAEAAGFPGSTFEETLTRFNQQANAGTDADFHRGESAYDRYYGDPTMTSNPNLRALSGKLFAVKVALSDLGTCGGLSADENGRVLREDGSAIDGLYAMGNTAGNAFGRVYPGAGGTIGQGLVFGYLIAKHAAS